MDEWIPNIREPMAPYVDADSRDAVVIAQSARLPGDLATVAAPDELVDRSSMRLGH